MIGDVPADDFQQNFEYESVHVALYFDLKNFLRAYDKTGKKYKESVRVLLKSASTNFVRLFSEGFQGLEENELDTKFRVILVLFMLNQKIFGDASLAKKYSKLIAKVLKTRPDFIEVCKDLLGQPLLPWNLSQSETQLAKSIRNFGLD
jgi:hypothetical protein